MKSNLLIFTLAVGGAMLLAGCTSPGGEDETEVVEMKGSQFQPKELTIEPGTKVTWVNRDSIGHDVTANDGTFASDTLNGGQTFEFTFDEPGVYEYHCTPHSFPQEDGYGGMTGTIIVLNEDGSTPTADGGAGNETGDEPGNETA